MTKRYGKHLSEILGWWVDMVGRKARWVVLLACLFSGASFYYSISHLGINTDTAEMLSETLPFLRNYNAFKKAFPQFTDGMLIVIDGETPELAQDASTALAARMKRETDLFWTVYLPGGDNFFQKQGLMYLSTSELEDLADNLARMQPFLGSLTRDQSLRGFFSMLARATKAVVDGEDLDLSQVYDQVNAAITASIHQRHYILSWQELMLGDELTKEHRRRFILAKPRLDYSRLLPAETAFKTMRRLIEELHLTEDYGVKVRLTGEAALEYEEMLSVSRGAGVAGILALGMVGIVLFVGLGSPRLVLSTLVTLIMGLVWTGCFASVVVGQLNLISVAFAVLYIGLSVDYAIHFCLRYKELIQQSKPHSRALKQTAQDIGSSLALCSVTTAIGFYAFIPTVFEGVAELGIISGTGMFISLIANLTVLPALLSLMPISPRAPAVEHEGKHWGARLLSMPTLHSRAIRIGALLLGIGALLLLPHVTFDHNPMNLRDPDSESVETFKELLAQSRNSPWTLTVLAANSEDASFYADRLGGLEPVAMSVTLDKFVPTEQDERLAVIEEISLIVGPGLLGTNQAGSPSPTEQVAALRDFATAVARLIRTIPDSQLATSAGKLYHSLNGLIADLEAQDPAARVQTLGNLQTSLLGSLPVRLHALNISLQADRFTKDDLPEDLVEHWVADDGRYRVTVFPRENLSETATMRRFVAAVRTVAPDAIGFPVIYLEAGDAVVKAFQQALLLSLIAITALLLLLLHPRSDALLVLLPLLLAGALTGAASVLLGIPFNFANIIALPLLLGIGVDSGIHMVHRMRAAPSSSGQMLQTSTAKAVFFSSLTTLCGFGNLAASPHRGMASMGLLLTVGIGFTLLCILVVLPALTNSSTRVHREEPRPKLSCE